MTNVPIRIWYLAEGLKFNGSPSVDLHNYYKVLTIPKAEISSDDAECINILVKKTHYGKWRATGKRAIKYGDVITIGPRVYLLVSTGSNLLRNNDYLSLSNDKAAAIIIRK